MYFTTVLTASLAPLAVLAASFEANMESDLAIRQEAPVKPTPCVRDNSVTAEETKARSEIFAKAFMYDKDISKAWSFVVSDYIVRCPVFHLIPKTRTTIPLLQHHSTPRLIPQPIFIFLKDKS
jgi:hypothetical protein